MGLGWHVSLEQDIPGVTAAATDGKSLVHYQHELDDLAHRLGLSPLTAFLSSDPARLAAYLASQGLNPEDFPLPEEEWFIPAEGLQTVRGLLAHLRLEPHAVHNSYRVLQDLQSIEHHLSVAEQAQVRFHLASDLPQLGRDEG